MLFFYVLRRQKTCACICWAQLATVGGRCNPLFHVTPAVHPSENYMNFAVGKCSTSMPIWVRQLQVHVVFCCILRNGCKTAVTVRIEHWSVELSADMPNLHCRRRALLSIALRVCWQVGRWSTRSPSFVSTNGDSKDGAVAFESSFSQLGRRTALVGALSLTQPSVALAKRGGGEGGDLVTKQAMPSTIEAEEPISEDWKPVDIGESSLVDPDDPKYKQMKLMNEIEKQKARNEEYNAMSAEETAGTPGQLGPDLNSQVQTSRVRFICALCQMPNSTPQTELFKSFNLWSHQVNSQIHFMGWDHMWWIMIMNNTHFVKTQIPTTAMILRLYTFLHLWWRGKTLHLGIFGDSVPKRLITPGSRHQWQTTRKTDQRTWTDYMCPNLKEGMQRKWK